MTTKVTSGGLDDNLKLTINQGSAATPSINFNNDTNTGMYSPNSDVIGFAVNGTEVVRISGVGLTKSDGSSYGGTSPDLVNSTTVVLYVNQSEIGANDSISNNGGNISTPFKTIERGLLECARRGYIVGANNDKLEHITLLIYPGEYIVDNRPGLKSETNISTVNIETEIYKFNPPTGGIIVPRGVSLVAIDPSKTVIRPKYVVNPNQTTSGVFWDAAYMIEQNRSYIQDQTFLFIQQANPTVTNINSKCRRDIGYIIDAIVHDIRYGGNSYSYRAAESYIVGTIVNYLTTPELGITITAINKVKDLCINALNNWTGTFGTYTEITSGKLENRVTFTVGNGYQSNGDCSSVHSAINSLSGLMVNILNNPTTYYSLYMKTVGLDEGFFIFKLTGGTVLSNLNFMDAKGVVYNSTTFAGDNPSFGTAVNENYSHHRCTAIGLIEHRYIGELTTYYKKIDIFDTVLDGGGSRDIRTFEYTLSELDFNSPLVIDCQVHSNYGMCGVYVDGYDLFLSNSYTNFLIKNFSCTSHQIDTNAFVADVTDTVNGNKYNWEHYGIKVRNAKAEVISSTTVGLANHIVTEDGGEVNVINSTNKFGGTGLKSTGFKRTINNKNVGYRILNVLPPKALTLNATSFVVAELNPNTVTTTVVPTTQLSAIPNITFPNNSNIFVNVEHPVTGAILVLSATLVATGATTTGNNFNIQYSGNIANASSLYQYLNLLGSFRFESFWNPTSQSNPDETPERNRRLAQLTNASIYVNRVLDQRSEDEKFYNLIVSSPTNKEVPNLNTIFSSLNLYRPNYYYVADVEQINSAELNANYNSLGNIFKIKLLRANVPSTTSGYDDIKDVVLSNSYKTILSGLDASVYNNTTLIPVSFDSTEVSRIAIYQLLQDLGYANPQIDGILTPNTGSTILSRFVSLPVGRSTESTVIGNTISFDLVYASNIVANGHTWNWVGYKNYTTGIPSNQIGNLSFYIKLLRMQSKSVGGYISANGVDELGNSYKSDEYTEFGGDVYKIRYDGVVRNYGLVSSNNLIAESAVVSNLRVNNLILDPKGGFKINNNGSYENVTENNKNLIATTINFGLVRRASSTEMASNIGNGYVSPPDLINKITGSLTGVNSSITGINNSITSINTSIGSLQLGQTNIYQTIDDNRTPIGSVIIFSGNTIPNSWLECNGAFLLRADYIDLFAAIGTIYGTSNINNFRLPDARGRFVIGSNTTYALGSTGGTSSVTLNPNNIPPHTHEILGSNEPGNIATQGLSATVGGAAGGSQGIAAYANTPYSYTTDNSDNVQYIKNSVGGSTPISIIPVNIAMKLIIKAFPV